MVFIGGGKGWRPGSIFLLDAVGLNWSSCEVTGGMGLSAQRCLHTAISVTGVETAADDDGDDPTNDKKGDDGELAGLPSSSTAAEPDDAAAAIPLTQQAEGSDAAGAVQLWNAISVAGVGGGAAAAAEPESARSAGSGKGGVGTSAKKKAGAKESAAAAKKSGGSTAAAGSTGGGGDRVPGGEDINGSVAPEAEGGAPAVFESVLIFGGIVDEAVVSGVSLVEDRDTTEVYQELSMV